MSGFSVPVFTAYEFGQVAAGGSIRVYQTGTTTLVTCYSDGALTIPITNPITLDSNGRAKFYVSGSTNLRIDSYDLNGTFIETVDPVLPVAGASTTSAGSVLYQAVNFTLSAANLSNNIISTAPINIALPLTSGFANSFSVQLNAQGGAITLIPNAADSIQKQTVGTNYVLQQGATGELWTDAAGNWGLNFLYIIPTAASAAQQVTGTSNTVYVTPLVQQNHQSACKAWADFGVSGGVLTIKASYNITSITRNSTGNYSVAFTTKPSTANYAVTGSSQDNGSGVGSIFIIGNGSKTINGFGVLSITPSTTAAADSGDVSFSCFWAS